MNGKMIQIKVSRGKRRVQISHEPSGPYNLPLRFEHLKEQLVNYRGSPEKVYRLTGPGVVARGIRKKRQRGVLERRLKEIIAAVLFAALLLLST